MRGAWGVNNRIDIVSTDNQSSRPSDNFIERSGNSVVSPQWNAFAQGLQNLKPEHSYVHTGNMFGDVKPLSTGLRASGCGDLSGSPAHRIRVEKLSSITHLLGEIRMVEKLEDSLVQNRNQVVFTAGGCSVSDDQCGRLTLNSNGQSMPQLDTFPSFPYEKG
jgi:hypothetical protein